MSRSRYAVALTLVTCLLAAPAALGQAPEALAGMTPSISWTGSSGTNVTSCFGFTCTPLVVPVATGETATLTLTGDMQLPYVLAVSTGANQCLTVPGVGNSFTLDPGFVILSQGLITQFNNIAICGIGMAQFQATIPAGIAPGVEIAVQGLSFGFDLQNGQIGPQFITPLLLTF